MDQDRRPDHRPHLPLLHTHLRTGTLEACEQARREAEEQARRQEAERAAARRQQQIDQLQAQMRDRAAAEDWDAVLTASDQLGELDPAAADPGGLATAAREQITRCQQVERAKVGASDAADDRPTALNELFRRIADAQGLTEADLRARLTGWSDNAVGAYLSGARQPGWNFVTAFLDVVAAHNPGIREVLERRLRPVWEETARPAVRQRSVLGVIGVAIALIGLTIVVLIVVQVVVHPEFLNGPSYSP